MALKYRIGFLQATNTIDVQWFRPLSFGYLKAYLQKHLNDAVDMEFLDSPEAAASFDIICISSTSQAFSVAQDLAAAIRKIRKDSIIILGGHHVTYFPQSLSGNFDVGVIGEGEETFLEFVRHYADRGPKLSSEDLRTIRGIVFRENGTLVKTSPRDLISPLDSIPYPVRTKDSAYLFSSRGCPYRCSFCSSSAFWRETRFFSAEYVVREVEHLLAEFPDLSSIDIWDDLFVANKSRFHKFVGLIEERQINKKVSFSFSVRANLVDDALCAALKRINVFGTAFGAESGTDKVLKMLNKGTTVEVNQRALDTLYKHNIGAKCSFIVGVPTETEDDVRRTYDFIFKNVLAGKLDPTSPVNILIPMPGTKIWDYAVKNGIIDEENMDWTRLSAYASYRNSTLPDFSSWVEYRRRSNTVYLADDTLPQDRLYEIMSTSEGILASLGRREVLMSGEPSGHEGKARDKDAQINELMGALKDRDLQIEELHAYAADRDKYIAHMVVEAATIGKQLEQIQQQNVETVTRLKDIEDSLSWRTIRACLDIVDRVLGLGNKIRKQK